MLRECMKAWFKDLGCVLKQNLQVLGKGLYVEGVYKGVVYRLGVCLKVESIVFLCERDLLGCCWCYSYLPQAWA